MTKYSKLRAALMGLVLSTAISMPSLAVAQMSGGMGHDKMMPMGDGKMEGEMPMPEKMPPKKPGCCGKMGGMGAKPMAMPAKSAKPHHHHRAKTKAKAKPAAARRAPATTTKPAAVTAKPAPAKPMPPMKDM